MSYMGLPEESILIHPNKVARIEDSQYIKKWYKTGVLGDHHDRWNITFFSPIEYSVEELSDPYQYKIVIKNLNNNTPKYVVRCNSSSLRNAISCYSKVLHMQLVSEGSPSIIKDDKGFFCYIDSFENEEEAKDLLTKLNEFIKDDDDLLYEFLFTIERRGL